MYSLEEIVLAVDAVAPAEALLGQLSLAVAALEALAVPVSVQHFEDEAVHDVLTAARTHWDLCRRQQANTSGLATPVGITSMCHMLAHSRTRLAHHILGSLPWCMNHFG